MRILLIALLAVGGVLAKAGPDTALEARLEKGPFALALKGIDSCPPAWNLRLGTDLPDPGWSLRVDSVERAKDGRILVKITSERKPGAYPQVITPGFAEAKLGSLRKGRYLVEIHYRRGAGARHELVQAAILRAT